MALSVKDFESAVETTASRHRLFKTGDRVGIALSGGADSVATLLSLSALGITCVALHCNFSLRGDESDGDERFCRSLAMALGCEYRSVRFATISESRQRESIEMTCRRLRYDWFLEMAATLNLSAIAIGHHREDSVETVMLNLFRGTGMRGLRGIAYRRGIFVRPLLDRSKEEILQYLADKSVGFRTDSSNLTDDYRRNYVRNQVMPCIEKAFPDADKGILTTACRMSDAWALFDTYLSDDLQRYADGDRIDVSKLAHESDHAADKLYYFATKLYDGGISKLTAGNIIRSHSRSGLTFKSENGLDLELSRGVLSPLLPEDLTEYTVDLHAPTISVADLDIDCRVISRADFASAPKDRDHAYFDARLLDGDHVFTLRHPRQGDRIAPFGMKGSRLLSDIFNDRKLTLSEKRSQWLFCRDNEIIWIPRIRASRHYPVTDSTDKVIALSVNLTAPKKVII